MRHRLFAATLLGLLASVATARAQEFSYLPPGDLAPGSGEGRADDKVYAPGILFPIVGKAYANSQVYGVGGLYGPSGSQCAEPNYSYPWRDNYCEKRSWDMPLCPAGTGHQGQDIRAETCEKDVHWSVASVDGTITNVGSYSVYLTAADGTRFDYLHMDSVQVAVGDKVKRGDKLGRVSNNFGGTATSVHLHFNIRQNVDGLGLVYVPPYLSLAEAYGATQAKPPKGALELADCSRIGGWAFDPEAADAAVEVELEVDGKPGSQDQRLSADRKREDLCESLGSCDHGFSSAAPLSLFDGAPHVVRVQAIDLGDGTRHELLESPAELTCGPIEPEGVRRPMDAAARKAWGLTTFWDQLPGDASALPVGPVAPDQPQVHVDPADPSRLWVVDGGERRPLDAADAEGWHLDAAQLPVAEAAVMALPEGRPMPSRASLVVVDGQRFLLDSERPADAGSGGNDGTAGLSGTSESSGCALPSSGSRGLTPGWLLALIAGSALARAARTRARSR